MHRGRACTKTEHIYGYSAEPSDFYKLYFGSPTGMRAAKQVFETGIRVGQIGFVRFKTLESNFPYVLRFKNDTGITGVLYVTVSSYVDIDEQDISVQRFGCSAIERVIFCLLETAEIPRATVLSYATERELIMVWKAFYDATDPDIIIGYNIKSFDFSYMLERAEVLNVRNFARLGRSTQLCRVVTRNLYSSIFGAFYAKDISFDGRPIFDLLHIIRRDHKLRSYSLNAVSFHFLGEQKEDMDHASMFGLQNGARETRRRIASY
jgi:DNA polymerase delta subunit 1